MSLILTGNGNQIAMAAPGRPMLLGASSGVVTPIVAATLSGVPGLAGWWDASLPTGMLSTSGTPLTAFGAPVAAVADKSDATMALNVWHAASAGTTRPIATPRLNGVLGGIGRSTVIPPNVPQSGQQLPVMDPDQGLIGAAMALGSGAAVDDVPGLVAAELAAEGQLGLQHVAEHRWHNPCSRPTTAREPDGWCCFRVPDRSC